jgi:5-methylcytosine-specific restriction endonuclease McrA
MKQDYVDNNLKFLTIISYSKKSYERAFYKSNKVKSKFDLSQERKEVFYSSPEWKLVREWVLNSYKNICFSCGSINNLEVDHIQPISRFPHGALKYKNFQILCRSCNSLKSNKTSRRFKTGIHKKKPFIVSEDVKALGKFNYWHKFFPLKDINEELSIK